MSIVVHYYYFLNQVVREDRNPQMLVDCRENNNIINTTTRALELKAKTAESLLK